MVILSLYSRRLALSANVRRRSRPPMVHTGGSLDESAGPFIEKGAAARPRR
jgi:hypothetical protein